jgi:hypothetical protein
MFNNSVVAGTAHVTTRNRLRNTVKIRIKQMSVYLKKL